jgi:hypothetical protein
MKRFISIIVVLAVLALPLAAQEKTEAPAKSPAPWTPSLDFGFARQHPPLGYWLFNLEGSVSKNFLDNGIFPMTLKPYINAQASLVTVDGVVGVTWTPIALLVIDANTLFGTGWSIPAFGAHGLNLGTMANSDSKNGGLLWNVGGSATLQFDFGIVIPGDWTHVLVQATIDGHYWKYIGHDDTTWVWQNVNYIHNGLAWTGTFVLGYQFPEKVKPLQMAVVQTAIGTGPGIPDGKLTITTAAQFAWTPNFSMMFAFIYDRTSPATNGRYAGAVTGSWHIWPASKASK